MHKIFTSSKKILNVYIDLANKYTGDISIGVSTGSNHKYYKAYKDNVGKSALDIILYTDGREVKEKIFQNMSIIRDIFNNEKPVLKTMTSQPNYLLNSPDTYPISAIAKIVKTTFCKDNYESQ